MVAWCRHRICVGFHIIPKMEGRNDVFSALVTRWPTAPRMLVYDNACAQQYYNYLREPEFFQSTLHVIDEMHSTNHTCCEAFKIGKYKPSHPAFRVFNDSAAESGNASLAHIKDSARYMTKANLMDFARLTLEMHNRLRIKEMATKMTKTVNDDIQQQCPMQFAAQVQQQEIQRQAAEAAAAATASTQTRIEATNAIRAAVATATRQVDQAVNDTLQAVVLADVTGVRRLPIPVPSITIEAQAFESTRQVDEMLKDTMETIAAAVQRRQQQ